MKITLDIPNDQAMALAQLVKRITWDDVHRLSDRFSRYPDGQMERDVMLDGINTFQRALAEAGFAPR